jgi:hypothetical protein
MQRGCCMLTGLQAVIISWCCIMCGVAARCIMCGIARKKYPKDQD